VILDLLLSFVEAGAIVLGLFVLSNHKGIN